MGVPCKSTDPVAITHLKCGNAANIGLRLLIERQALSIPEKLNEAEKSDITFTLTNNEPSDGYKEFRYSEKPFTSWIEDDFPNKPDGGRRGVNKVLGLYADAQKALFKKRPFADDTEPICCDGVVGLLGFLFLLLVDIAYVIYACLCKGLDRGRDVHLLWLSVIFWPRHYCTICLRRIMAAIMLGFTASCTTYYVIMVNVVNLTSLSGISLLLLISIALSKFLDKINWQPVLNCFFLQLLVAFLTLKTHAGYVTFDFLGKRMAEFLENSLAGSRFVFGASDCFAFSTEAPLITRSYSAMSTNSELHAMIFNGFTSIAGPVLAAFISSGVPPNHLLIACIISAPAALAVSKIIYPETKISPVASSEFSLKLKSPYNSVLEAAMVNAMEAVPICAGITANLIAFLSIYNFFNRILIWLGKCGCLEFDLTFEMSWF
ncbi:Sodium/nucleoside cotransporter 2 [Echinococcus granulosus]|uniref:Na+ dependent nucleoside transporter n=1 Tax=Echinococcus granulosus TaxID=6210 RepID=A0A068WPS2_ECHGR|nr:Sodium/nucleoside cotransporter 2 [Echinococcus granulosus]CDS21771.1 Na+ dependent nucleoside transporter [Echinococcus granulosus]